MGTAVFIGQLRRNSLRLSTHVAAQVVVAGFAFGGALLWSHVEAGRHVGGALRYPGAIIGILTAISLLRLDSRLSFRPFLDALFVSLPFGFATMRVGCFLAGCCFGRPTDLPWAVTFPHGTAAWQTHRLEGFLASDAATSLPVHPLQVYFGVWAALVGCFLLWHRRRQRFAGELALLYLALHESGKYVLELIRYRPLPAVQFVSGAVAVAALVAVVFAYRSHPVDGAAVQSGSHVGITH